MGIVITKICTFLVCAVFFFVCKYFADENKVPGMILRQGYISCFFAIFSGIAGAAYVSIVMSPAIGVAIIIAVATWASNYLFRIW